MTQLNKLKTPIVYLQNNTFCCKKTNHGTVSISFLVIQANSWIRWLFIRRNVSFGCLFVGLHAGFRSTNGVLFLAPGRKFNVYSAPAELRMVQVDPSLKTVAIFFVFCNKTYLVTQIRLTPVTVWRRACIRVRTVNAKYAIYYSIKWLLIHKMAWKTSLRCYKTSIHDSVSALQSKKA